MAQTTLTIYAGDQLFKSVDFSTLLFPFLIIWPGNSTALRLTGTIVGLIVGLLIWYIGK
jgi:hypothetical protein